MSIPSRPMKSAIILGLFLFPFTALPQNALGEDPPLSKFEQLATLVGEWKGIKPSQEGEETIMVHYELTAKGTALVETLFPGSTKEMVSIYAQDGQEVIMTHYCMLGNHPRMRTIKQESPQILTLAFIDGTGMRSLDDMHMHQLTIHMTDNQHMTHKWTLYDKGKKKVTSIFDFTRTNPLTQASN